MRLENNLDRVGFRRKRVNFSSFLMNVLKQPAYLQQ